jgi:hypothetical protein
MIVVLMLWLQTPATPFSCLYYGGNDRYWWGQVTDTLWNERYVKELPQPDRLPSSISSMIPGPVLITPRFTSMTLES